MRSDWIEDAERFLVLRDAWNELLRESHNDLLFMRHEWLSAWWQAYGRAADLRVLLLYDDGRLIGAAPLMRSATRWHGLPIRLLKFTSSGVTPRSFLLARDNDPSVIGELLTALQSVRAHWDMLELADIPIEVYDNAETQEVFRRCSPRTICVPSRQSPYLDLTGSYEDFLAARSANTRSRYRRAWKKVSAAGHVELRKLTSNEDVMSALEDAFLVSARSWKGDFGTDMASTAASRDFYTRLADVGSRNGWVTLWMLYLNGSPVAMQFHVLYGGCAYLLRTDFDKNQNDLSPGTALEARILEDYFSSDLREYDMCGMNYDYKLKLTNRIRQHVTVSVYNDRAYSRFLYHSRRHLIPAVKRLLPARARAADSREDGTI